MTLFAKRKQLATSHLQKCRPRTGSPPDFPTKYSGMLEVQFCTLSQILMSMDTGDPSPHKTVPFAELQNSLLNSSAAGLQIICGTQNGSKHIENRWLRGTQKTALKPENDAILRSESKEYYFLTNFYFLNVFQRGSPNPWQVKLGDAGSMEKACPLYPHVPSRTGLT